MSEITLSERIAQQREALLAEETTDETTTVGTPKDEAMPSILRDPDLDTKTVDENAATEGQDLVEPKTPLIKVDSPTHPDSAAFRFDTYAMLPELGVANAVYLTTDTGNAYCWNGTGYDALVSEIEPQVVTAEDMAHVTPDSPFDDTFIPAGQSVNYLSRKLQSARTKAGDAISMLSSLSAGGDYPQMEQTEVTGLRKQGSSTKAKNRKAAKVAKLAKRKNRPHKKTEKGRARKRKATHRAKVVARRNKNRAKRRINV